MSAVFSGGGPVFVVIAFAFVASGAVFFLRLLEMRRAHLSWDDFFRGVRNNLVNGRDEEALALCEDATEPLARIAAAGIRHRNAAPDVRKAAVATAASTAANRLVRRLAPLALVAQTAPLLGLFGTVAAFMRTVNVLNSDLLVVRADLLDGLMHALIPAAAGLFTAIVAHVEYANLDGMLARLVDEFSIAESETLATISDAEVAGGAK